MSAQHTPGPWFVDRHARNTFIKDESGSYIAEMDIGAMDHGADHALIDACLIAAAPELLEALTQLMAITDDPANDADEEESVFPFARAVIAKASATPSPAPAATSAASITEDVAQGGVGSRLPEGSA